MKRISSKNRAKSESLYRFRQDLMHWHRRDNRRQMPWKGQKDPYRIWLAEIILQQTRVEQGLSYYQAFVTAYPTVQHLAGAPDDEVFKKWEGLGYYSRCRNLLATAREIAGKREGLFPDNYRDLLRLKGIGPYTAAAISSFAFGLPHAVVDGNVIRVLSRYMGIDTPFDTSEGRKLFDELAQQALDPERPGEYNQAIMDFGATVCKPLAPVCDSCPLAPECRAYALGKQKTWPVRSGKINRRTRYFTYFLLRHNGRVWVRQREGRDIWRHLHDFWLMESEEAFQWSMRQLKAYVKMQWGAAAGLSEVSDIRRQLLTHQEIRARFVMVDLESPIPLGEAGRWLRTGQLNRLAFPRIINEFLDSLGDTATG